MFRKTPLPARVWTWLAALAASAAACRSTQARTPTWVSDDSTLDQRVRAGEPSGVKHARFWSKTLQRDVGAVIVTPPSYDSDTDRRYPVVYVFPGIGGDEWTYLRDVGLESTAMKALWTEPTKAPLVVFGNPGDSGGHQHAAFVLSEELVGFVDQNYRTRTDANGRSLEGFSLGGATALTLLLHRPDVFGRAVAISSACYLLPECDALRAGIVAHAKRQPNAKVLLAIGERDVAKNRAINDELAPLLGVEVQVVPNADHDWAAQIATRMRSDGREFGSQISEFHLAGFALAPTPPR